LNKGEPSSKTKYGVIRNREKNEESTVRETKYIVVIL